MKKTGLQKRIFEGLFIMLFIRLLLFPSGRSFFFRLTLHELSTLYRLTGQNRVNLHGNQKESCKNTRVATGERQKNLATGTSIWKRLVAETLNFWAPLGK
jgi:hypothetical protein